MEKRLWLNTGLPLTSYQWVGGMFALAHETLSRIDASQAQPDKWFTPLTHNSLAPFGRDEEYDRLAYADQ